MDVSSQTRFDLVARCTHDIPRQATADPPNLPAYWLEPEGSLSISEIMPHSTVWQAHQYGVLLEILANMLCL